MSFGFLRPFRLESLSLLNIPFGINIPVGTNIPFRINTFVGTNIPFRINKPARPNISFQINISFGTRDKGTLWDRYTC